MVAPLWINPPSILFSWAISSESCFSFILHVFMIINDYQHNWIATTSMATLCRQTVNSVSHHPRVGSLETTSSWFNILWWWQMNMSWVLSQEFGAWSFEMSNAEGYLPWSTFLCLHVKVVAISNSVRYLVLIMRYTLLGVGRSHRILGLIPGLLCLDNVYHMLLSVYLGKGKIIWNKLKAIGYLKLKHLSKNHVFSDIFGARTEIGFF